MTIFFNAIIDLREGEERPAKPGAFEPLKPPMQRNSRPASSLHPSYEEAIPYCVLGSG